MTEAGPRDRLVDAAQRVLGPRVVAGVEQARDRLAERGQATLRQREAVDHIIVGRLRHDVRSAG